jgi:signal transduction histidine kinase
LERAAVNLIHNALKFTSKGGSVIASATCQGEAVILSVTDSGAGIAPEEQPRVFERFYKVDHARQSEGTGLGLAVVRHTVEAHGGTVSVKSQQGKGSTFTISLPVKPHHSGNSHNA